MFNKLVGLDIYIYVASEIHYALSENLRRYIMQCGFKIKNFGDIIMRRGPVTAIYSAAWFSKNLVLYIFSKDYYVHLALYISHPMVEIYYTYL